MMPPAVLRERIASGVCVLCGHDGPVKPNDDPNGGGLLVCVAAMDCMSRWPPEYLVHPEPVLPRPPATTQEPSGQETPT